MRLPLANVVLVSGEADVVVRRGGLQLLHLLPQSLRASQSHVFTASADDVSANLGI